MNYYKIYNDLIKRGINRGVLNCYTEKHHIIPKCLGGVNTKENIVILTAKEHFIAHRLLVRIYPENYKLIYALWRMCLKGIYTRNRAVVSSRIYENIKIEMSTATKNRLKVFNCWKGKIHTKESKIKMSESAKNRNISEENETLRRTGISQSNKGKHKSLEHCKNIAEAKIGNKNPMFGKTGKEHHNSKPCLQFTMDDVFIREWVNAKEAAKELKLEYKSINVCLNEKSKSSQGFKWKYKNIP